MVDEMNFKIPCLSLKHKIPNLCQCYKTFWEIIFEVFANCAVCKANGYRCALKIEKGSEEPTWFYGNDSVKRYFQTVMLRCDERNKLCTLYSDKSALHDNVDGVKSFFQHLHNPNTFLFCHPFFFQPNLINLSKDYSVSYGLTLNYPQNWFLAKTNVSTSNLTKVIFQPTEYFFAWGLQIILRKKILFRLPTLEILCMEKIVEHLVVFTKENEEKINFSLGYSCSLLVVCDSFLQFISRELCFLPENCVKKIVSFLKTALISVFKKEFTPGSSLSPRINYVTCTKCYFCQL